MNNTTIQELVNDISNLVNNAKYDFDNIDNTTIDEYIESLKEIGIECKDHKYDADARILSATVSISIPISILDIDIKSENQPTIGGE